MKTLSWKGIVEQVGIAAIAGSLIFVGLQMKQDRLIAEAQFYADADDAKSIASLVSENSNVWLTGLRGDELEPDEEVVFQNIFMASRFSYASFYESELRLGTLAPDWLSRRFAYRLFANPGLHRLWNTRLEFNRGQFIAYGLQHAPTGFELDVSNYLDELDNDSALPPEIENYAIW